MNVSLWCIVALYVDVCLVVDALLVAAQMLLEGDSAMTSGEKRIFLMTGVYSSCKTDDLAELVPQFQGSIHLNVLGANFWDDEDAPDTRAVPDAKKHNERELRQFVDAVGGRYYSLPHGCQLLSEFRTKAVRQVPTFTGTFELGNMSVPVRMFLQAKANPFPALKKLSAYSQLLQQQQVIEGQGGAGAEGDVIGQDVRTDDGEDNEIEEGTELPAVRMDVKMEREYVGVIEPEKQFARNDLVRGFRFGRTLVPFTKDELDGLKYKAERCLQVLHFAYRSNIPRHYFMGSAELMVAASGDVPGQQFISSLCKALLQDDDNMIKPEPNQKLHHPKVAIVRLVKPKGGGAPRLGCLLPCVQEGQYYGLLFHQLPFAEDIRKYSFPSLDDAQCRPAWRANAEQDLAMDDIVAVLDLDHAAEDEGELLRPEETFNPVVLHFFEAVRFRASRVPATVGNVIDPACVALLGMSAEDNPAMTLEEARKLPAIGMAVRQVLEPSKGIWSSPRALSAVERLQNCVNLQVVPKKTGKRKGFGGLIGGGGGAGGAAGLSSASVFGFGGFGNVPDLSSYNFGGQGVFGTHDEPEVLAGGVDHKGKEEEEDREKGGASKRGKKDKAKLTLDQLLNGQGVMEVGTVDPVRDFWELIGRRDVDKVYEALVQMERIVRMLVQQSVHGHLYSKAVECLGAMREGCVREMEAEHWNGVLRSLRTDYQSGPHHAFWLHVVRAGITLIHDEESGESDVTREQAARFLLDSHEVAEESSPHPMQFDQDEDMFGQME